MKYLGKDAWNLQNDHQDIETDVVAEEGDLVFEIGGIFFLVMRENDFNNIICKRITKSKMTFREVIIEFRQVMIEQNIQYIRVEGSLRRYMFLLKMLPEEFGIEVGIFKEPDTDNRNVFYIKCF